MTVLDEARTHNGAELTAPQHALAPMSPPAAAEAPAAATAAAVPPEPAQDDPAQTVGKAGADAARRHALWFFWAWLLFTTVVSIGGNVIHAWMTAPEMHLKLLAAIAAAVPPAVLLGSTHSVALLIRTRRRGYRRVDAIVLGAALLLTVGVAVCAFAMSFFSLRDLIIMLGMSRDIAWLWPIAVDLSLICSTLALLSLTPPQTEDSHASAVRTIVWHGPAPASAAGTDAAVAAAAVNPGPQSPAERRLWWEGIAAAVREQLSGVRKVAEMTTGQLGEVLERMYDKNESGRVISDTTPLHHREIKAIKETADGVLARTAVPTLT
ncbi:Protein of unknown function (DUF2637) (plasmid) [Mycobacterium sp. JS623]|uniref:DUF2637 domain-containing protein n=1 Tax=Mycobacterium sp. JS623 TaxID=212767 RepID=UPI0002A56E15|nr:DUF2637 domain-containing protein [Mycobacterium sp. JS623]AGB27391.1 Protein of unknown function (DUF2637) [Mycobacterium sp. JS623]